MSDGEDDLFSREMTGVKPIKPVNRADVQVSQRLTPGHLERRRMAAASPAQHRNPLSSAEVDMLSPYDELSFKRSGVQDGVFRKLRLGKYPIEARLDLHRKTVEEARVEVFQFVRDCMRYDIRSVMILHGKGEHRSPPTAILKSYVAHWLPELGDVLAFHSAQQHHGGRGAVYVLLRKSERKKQENREQHGGR